jgi:hypothetical protein
MQSWIFNQFPPLPVKTGLHQQVNPQQNFPTAYQRLVVML